MNFDLVSSPLNKGVSRLEASAGTGKTYTLAGLFVRLLLQEKVSARDILVVTFTEAATAELRDRIRKRLSEALAVFQGQPTTDSLLLKLAADLTTNRSTAIASIRNALEVFDLVSIYTIHSFCQRTLQDCAFESGTLFDVDLVPDQEDLVRQVAADYCRKCVQTDDLLMASVALEAKLDPDTLSRLLRQSLTYPKIELVTAQAPRPIEVIAAEIHASFDACMKACQSLGSGSDALIQHFTGGKKWAVKEHAKPVTVAQHSAYLQSCDGSGSLSAEFWKAVRFFCTSAIDEETGKGKTQPPPLSLFEPCESLTRLVDEFATAHRLAFLQSAAEMLALAKQQAKRQSFDDLITRLATALDSSSGPALAESVRRRYRAALIDESQDTDPLQWKIFRTIFATSADHWLCLIGDPKQAIYAFRGADVHTYIQTAGAANDEYSLGTNWRSESPLVHAVNALFASSGPGSSFLEEAIAFQPVSPGPEADKKPISFPDGPRPPFHVWCWAGEKGDVTAKAAQRVLPGAVAAETSMLLSTGVRIGKRRLQPRDIAILVESHKQARWIQEALHKLAIPSVEQAMESVFESEEARELQWILAALLAPSRESGVKAALTTDVFGLNGTGLLALVQDETGWQTCLQAFARYRQDWEEHGFFFMFMRLLRHEQVLEKLLRFPDAERRITNLLHLAEILEAACKAEHLGPARLVQWIEQRRLSGEAAPEEFQLRLESDEDAVQIITIHRAKGLEYPVVFCPFVSKDAKLRSIKVNRRKVLDLVLYHDSGSGQLCWDLDVKPNQEHSRLAAKEQLAEKVRLLYVALTRARNRCYLVSARYGRSPSTALAWLMRASKAVPQDILEAFKTEKVQPGQWKTRWQEIGQASAQAGDGQPGIAIEDLPTAAGQPWIQETTNPAALSARVCPRKIEPAWFLSSFTQLASQFSTVPGADTSLPDHDETTVKAAPELLAGEQPVSPSGIFALPSGARTGDCLHRILERLDFATATEQETRLVVQEELVASNLAEYVPAVLDMLGRIRQIRFDSESAESTLADVAPGKRLTELEFCFPAAHADTKALLGTIREPVPGALPGGKASSRRLAMFLKGFIDLVFEINGRFHIIDWKSNLLGFTTDAYTPQAMQTAIHESYYDLQYHLYTVALDKFLRQRLPGYQYDQHFGGVHYVFLRGLDPARPDLGVFHDRPPSARIEELASLLACSPNGSLSPS